MIVSMIIETIRKYIKTCGKTRYRISKETGVGEYQLCRIVNKGKKRKGSCSIETADILCKYLELELTPKKSKKKGKRR